MEAINKKHISNLVASFFNIKSSFADVVVDAYIEVMREELLEGRRVQLFRGCRLTPNIKKARVGRDPRTLKEYEIAARVTVVASQHNKFNFELSKKRDMKVSLVQKLSSHKKIMNGKAFNLTHANEVIEIFKSVFEGVRAGEFRIEIRSFGTFYCREYKERVSRNPKTGETLLVGSRAKLAFKLSEIFKDQLMSSEFYSKYF